ncbi:MAG TPA: PAS domain S-box protein [Desulfobulbus sp.]|nr:PAS domain S-box protein [Desulfobulbus sp.]
MNSTKKKTIPGKSFIRLTSTHSTSDQLRHHILWLLLIRIIFFTLLIGITVVLGSLGTQVILPSDTLILAFLAILFIFSVGSSAILQKQDLNLRRFGFIQLLGDTFFAALLVYGTGCSQSIFTPVFILPVIAGGLIMYRKGGLMSAAAATLLYGAILFMEYRGIVPGYMTAAGWVPTHSVLKVTNLFAIYGVTFFITALLSGSLAARLQSTEEALSRTSVEFDRLSVLYKQIFDDIATGIITVDEQGRITSYNAAAGRITGYLPEETAGRLITTLFPGLQLEDNGTRRVVDLQKKDGTMIRAGYSFSPLNLPSDPASEKKEPDSCKVITLQDISAVEKMEKRVREAEKMAAIGELSASIAHDFRNPLAAISGSAQLLVMENEGKEDTGRSLSEIIFRESKRMAKTITEFLQFARPAPMHAEWFALKRSIDEAISAAQTIKEARECDRIKVEVAENLDAFGDRQQLQTILVHLIENGLIFSREGNGIVTIKAHEQEQEGKNVLSLEVIDQGHGIEPEILDTIFKPFYSTRENGTGLGLAIVRQIVEMHGGSVEVESAPAKGCTMRIILPLPSYEA